MWIKRADLGIIVLDGVLGVLIGTTTLAVTSMQSPVAQGSRMAVFFTASVVMQILLGIPMLIATMALTPILLRYLRHQLIKPLSSGSFYTRSALSGIMFGVAATAGVGFVLGLMIPFLPDAGTAGQRAVLLIGAPPFLALGAAFTALFYIGQIVVTGTAFGVLNGWLVRRSAARV